MTVRLSGIVLSSQIIGDNQETQSVRVFGKLDRCKVVEPAPIYRDLHAFLTGKLY